MKKEKKPRTGKSLTRKFDKIWKERCFDVAEHKCEFCGTTENLNTHHIIGRKNYSTRWYIPNGITLCAKHHTFDSEFSAHQNPLAFAQWILTIRGQNWWNDIIKRKNEVWHNWKLHLEDIEKHLNEFIV